jgi:hypothetical protein
LARPDPIWRRFDANIFIFYLKRDFVLAQFAENDYIFLSLFFVTYGVTTGKTALRLKRPKKGNTCIAFAVMTNAIFEEAL